MRDLHDTPEFQKALSEAAASKLGYLSDTEDSISVNGKALAEMLNVSQPAISQAVKNKTQVNGYFVHNWAATNSRGRVIEYIVPINIYKELKGRIATGSGQSRSNPSDLEMPNNGEFGELLDLAGGNTNVHSPTSLLPEGEDYSKSVGLASAGYVMRNLLDTEKPQGKAFTVAALSGGLAVGGKFIFESNSAGVAGGVIGLLIGLLYLENPFTERLRERNESLQDAQRTKRVYVPVPENKPDRKESEPKSNISLVK